MLMLGMRMERSILRCMCSYMVARDLHAGLPLLSKGYLPTP